MGWYTAAFDTSSCRLLVKQRRRASILYTEYVENCKIALECHIKKKNVNHMCGIVKCSCKYYLVGLSLTKEILFCFPSISAASRDAVKTNGKQN